MQINDAHPVDQIRDRLVKLQQSHVVLQDQLKLAKIQMDRHVDDASLRIIDILDLIHTVPLNESNESHSNARIIIKKTEKRLTDLLRRWEVQEILIDPSGQIKPGKARVLEARSVAHPVDHGTIVEVCRKGYQRGGKPIRPADVITYSNKEASH